MKKFKQILATMLVAIMMLAVMPVNVAFAEETYQQLTLNTDTSVRVRGDEVTLSFTPEKDGSYKFQSTGPFRTYATLYDSDWNELSSSVRESKDNNFQLCEMLKGGNVYYLSVNIFESGSGNFKVKVTETTGIASATITKYPDDMTCIDGYIESSIHLYGLEMLFVTTDGEEINWTFGEMPMVGEFRINYEELYMGDDGYYHVLIKCGGTSTELLFKVVENPVLNIEYHSNKDIVLYENTGGYYFDDDLYIYDYEFPKDAYFVINYKDGSSVKCYEYDVIDGYTIRTYDDQYDTPFSVGENFVHVKYMGNEIDIPVYVKGCEFKSVTVNSAPDREYVFGDMKYGWLDERNKYEFQPTDISGLHFTVEYEDGSVEHFSDADFDIKNGKIAGYDYGVKECVISKPGKVNVTLMFMGAEINYNVTVVESPLKSFEMTWYPELTDYEDRFMPIFDGAEFTLTFKDGTQEVVVLSDENTTYGDGNYVDYEVTVGDYTIEIFEGTNGSDIIYGFCCLGKWVDYEGMWFDESREIESVEVAEFTPDVDGMVVNIKYTDGSEDTLTYKVVSRCDKNKNSFYGYAKTEKGIVHYYVEKIYENGEVIGCKVSTLGEEFTVMGSFVTVGDVDGDGTVSIMDTTAVQRHLTSEITLSGDSLKSADADKNGEVTIMDATQIQLYVAKLIEKF
ncbi:MAG: dockerin type I repeat-containing protein [Ruminococcus sp.]|nr:dockerin type I repeat-containing protein [Ruminococcus sp.]